MIQAMNKKRKRPNPIDWIRSFLSRGYEKDIF